MRSYADAAPQRIYVLAPPIKIPAEAARSAPTVPALHRHTLWAGLVTIALTVVAFSFLVHHASSAVYNAADLAFPGDRFVDRWFPIEKAGQVTETGGESKVPLTRTVCFTRPADRDEAVESPREPTILTLASVDARSVALDRARPAPSKRGGSEFDEVEQYLWEVYQREPVKKDGSGDFTWKDPAAAKRMGMSLQRYVISGMDTDFREQLYHAGRAMDAEGLKWSMLSAFRDDYRQQIASGLKAGSKNSRHGGSRRTGGYGHGQAIDITGTDGTSMHEVRRWIDQHGAKYGLNRPMPGYDPAHIQARSNWHQLAQSLRGQRVSLALQREREEAAKAKLASSAN